MTSFARDNLSTVRYRLLRELGHRSTRTFAAMRRGGEALEAKPEPSSLVVVQVWTTRAPSASSQATHVSATELGALAREATLLEKNWHPNVARVRHVDVSEDTLHVATELLDGVTFEDLLTLANAKSLTLHPEEPIVSHAVLARVFIDVLSGVAAIHGLREDGATTSIGAYHGALCPANVVVGRDGVARVIAAIRPRPPRVTAESESLGYTAPELFAEVDAIGDARSDIFSMGVLLWESLTERRLYPDLSEARVAQRQREDEVERPNARLADVALKALAFDPFARYRSANDMIAAIRATAGTVATGSTVAQIVQELAGDRIRARRVDLNPSASGQRRAVTLDVPTTRTRSGSIPRVEAAARETPREELDPAAETTRDLTQHATEDAPPEKAHSERVDKAPSSSRRIPSVGRVRHISSRELRAVAPASSDVPRPKPPRHPKDLLRAEAIAAEKETASAEASRGPEVSLSAMESTPDHAYLNGLITESSTPPSEAGKSEVGKSESIDWIDSLESPRPLAPPITQLAPRITLSDVEPEVVAIARSIQVSHRSSPPESPDLTGSAEAAPAPIPFAKPIMSIPVPEKRTPVVIARPRSATVRRWLPLVTALALVSIGVLLAGAAIIARRSQSFPTHSGELAPHQAPNTEITAPATPQPTPRP